MEGWGQGGVGESDHPEVTRGGVMESEHVLTAGQKTGFNMKDMIYLLAETCFH